MYKKITLFFVSCLFAINLFSQTTYNFNTCSATGRYGPTQSQVNASYASGNPLHNNVTISTGGIQEWTVPETGAYSLVVSGAGGGSSNNYGGRGRIIRGEVTLSAGTVLKIVVGQKGGITTSSGGGGGSFVVDASGNRLIMAAGGGAGFYRANLTSSFSISDASYGSSGNNSFDGTGNGGTSGGGGTGSNNGWGAGGGGFSSNGTNSAYLSKGMGYSFLNGAIGGDTASSAYGGFGGGGGTHGNTGGGGGGGGYSGGGGSNQNISQNTGGGGGSYMAGDVSNASNQGLNTNKGSVIITSSSCINPVITCPSDIAINSLVGQCGANVTFSATATGTNPTITYSQASGSFFPVGITTITATASNSCGNNSCTFDVTVVDNIDPSVSIINENTPTHEAYTVYTDEGATASDNCSATITNTVNNVPANPAPGTYTVVYTATDGSSNTETGTRTVTVTDTTSPEAKAQNVTVELDSNGDGAVTAAQVNNDSSDASDVSGDNLTYTLSQTTFDCDDLDTGSNNYALKLNGGSEHALLSASNQDMGIQGTSFSVSSWIYRDDFNSADQGILSNNLCKLHLTIRGNKAYLGFCGNDISGNILLNPGQWYHLAFVYDANAQTQAIYVNGVLDVIQSGHAPLTADTPLRIGGYAGGNGLNGKIDEMSIWNSALSVTEVNNIMNDSPVGSESGLLGFWNFEDGAGTTVTDLTGRFNGTLTNISNTAGAWSTDVSPANASGNGGNEVTLTVTDASGNFSTATANVTVEDNEAPEITCVADATRDTNLGVCEYTVVGTEFDATFTDNCITGVITNDLNASATIAGVVLPLGITTVVWTVDDGNGQSDTCTTVITVEDNEAPEITCVADATRDTDLGVCEYTVVGTEFDATFTDNCITGVITNDLNNSATIAGEVLSLGITTVVWTVDDGNGQSDTCTTVITVEDNEAPEITCIADATIDTDSAVCTYTVVGTEYDATFTDNCITGVMYVVK